MTFERTDYGNWPDADAQARGWLVRLKSGAATQRDLDMLAGWRAESDANEQSFRRAVKLWDDLGPVLAGGGAMPHAQVAARAGVSRRWVMGGAGGLAATAAVALFVGGTPTPAGAKVFETQKGQRQRFTLEDQVVVDLNTNSRLLYWADAQAPRVTLDRGEAIVAAACEGDRYLLAQVRDVRISARTARFLLKSDGDAIRVACLDGRMSVRADGRDYPLTGGMEADFRGAAPVPVTGRVAEADLSWQRDLLQFTDRPAGEVIAELNRYRPGRVYLLGDRADVRISGVIHLKRADPAVDHIARSLGMTVTRLPGGIAILRGA